ncbi:hypothetical protein ACSSS7_002961 [Eimeria intestinalis]
MLADGDSADEKGSIHCTSSSVNSAETGQHKWSRSSSRSEHQAPPIGSDRPARVPLDYISSSRRRISASTPNKPSQSYGNDRSSTGSALQDLRLFGWEKASEAATETTSINGEQSQWRLGGPVLRKLPSSTEGPQGVTLSTEIRRPQAGKRVSAVRFKGWRRALTVKGRFAFRQRRSAGVIAAKFLSALGAPRNRRASAHAEGGDESHDSSNSDADGGHSESTRPLMCHAATFEGASWLNPSNKEYEI